MVEAPGYFGVVLHSLMDYDLENICVKICADMTHSPWQKPTSLPLGEHHFQEENIMGNVLLHLMAQVNVICLM
jgi:hypothetical protein